MDSADLKVMMSAEKETRMMIRMMGTAALVGLLCGGNLHAQTVRPAVSAGAVAFDPDAVNRAFNRLSKDERYVIQQRLQPRGFYHGTVDGLTRPETSSTAPGRPNYDPI